MHYMTPLELQNCIIFINIKRLYYFPDMWKMIHNYVRTCKKCQIMNLQKLNYISLLQDITQIQQDNLSIDLMGPL